MQKCTAKDLLKEAPSDEILNYDGAAKLYKVSVRTVEHRVRSGQIPFFRIGRAVRFSRNALLRHLYNQI